MAGKYGKVTDSRPPRVASDKKKHDQEMYRLAQLEQRLTRNGFDQTNLKELEALTGSTSLTVSNMAKALSSKHSATIDLLAESIRERERAVKLAKAALPGQASAAAHSPTIPITTPKPLKPQGRQVERKQEHKRRFM